MSRNKLPNTFNYSNIHRISCAKVGSSNLYHSLKNKYPTKHGHSLLDLKNIIENKKILLL